MPVERNRLIDYPSHTATDLGFVNIVIFETLGTFTRPLHVSQSRTTAAPTHNNFFVTVPNEIPINKSRQQHRAG